MPPFLSFHDESLGQNSECWGREFWGGSQDGYELLITTEATIGVLSNANGVLLGENLVVLCRSYTLSEVDPLEGGYVLQLWMVKVLFLAWMARAA